MSATGSHNQCSGSGPGTGDMCALYGYRSKPPNSKEVSFLEFVEVSTTDSSISPDLTNGSGSSGLASTATTTINVPLQHSPSRPPLPGGGVHHFHYEPLRPPAAIPHHHQQQQHHGCLSAQHSSSISSNNSNSSSSPSPLVTLPDPNLIPPYPEGYQLLLSPRPSLTPCSSSTAGQQPQFSAIFQTDNSHHLFPPTSASPQLLQFASHSSPSSTSPQPPYFSCSPAAAYANHAHNPTYDSLQAAGLGVPCLHAHPLPPSTTDPCGLLNEAVISKSSSSDSDTNDSATRLISDSLADIANHHIYLMHGQQQPQQPATMIPENPSNATAGTQQYTVGTLNRGEQESTQPTTTEHTSESYKNDALWIQMQSEISKEMREKYLANVNGSGGSSSNGPTNSSTSTSSSSKKKDKKKNFTFRRIGCGQYRIVCPLRQSTVRCLTMALACFLILASSLALLFCYLRGWWLFSHSPSRPFGPDPDQYWWQGTTFYEIFPPSFKDTDGDGFGDFNGITEQVAYLRSLGISAVRLSSIYAALDYPQRFDHVLDFTAVDPHLGKWEDFLKMINTLHSNQIRVILELNPTMTSDQHQWAVHWSASASNGTTNEYANFYENRTKTMTTSSSRKTGKDKFEEPPTSIDAQYSSPASPSSPHHHHTHLADTQFYFGSGLRLNWTHEPVRAQLLKVATFWLRHVDGLYLTNLHQIYLEPHLSGPHSRGAVLHDFLRKLRTAMDAENGIRTTKPGSSTTSRSRKILLCSSAFVDPFLSGLIKRRRSQDRRRSPGTPSHHPQFKPEFDDLDLDQLDPLDPTILANLHVMPYNQNSLSPTTTGSQSSSTSATPTKLKNSGKARVRKLYSYFDLVHFELNLSPTETDTIRDQVNYVFLNRPMDFPTILWSVGSIHQSRLADRIGEERVLAGHYLLTMMPGTVSLLYGDEIALTDVWEMHTKNKYRGGQLCPMAWSSHTPTGNFSLPNVTSASLWMPVHADFARVNVEKRSDLVKATSDLNHFRLDHLYSDVQPDGRPLSATTNYLFHYIDDSIVVLEQHFDRRNPGAFEQTSLPSLTDDYDPLAPPPPPPPSTRYRYVLFANLGNETLTKDFSDKFHSFSMTQLATNVNRTSQFLITKSLQLEPGEAMIATVE